MGGGGSRRSGARDARQREAGAELDGPTKEDAEGCNTGPLTSFGKGSSVAGVARCL